MKKLFIANLVLVMSVISSAHASGSDVQNFVKKVKDLNGRTGVVASSYENESTGVCRIDVEESEYGVSVSFAGTGYYFTPTALIAEDAEVESKNTLLVSRSSDRAGGDACGDFGGAINYKKKLSLNGREVRIEESFRCTFEGFKKYHLVSTCTL